MITTRNLLTHVLAYMLANPHRTMNLTAEQVRHVNRHNPDALAEWALINRLTVEHHQNGSAKVFFA